MMMEIRWLKDTMNQLVDCKIDMSELALLENHTQMAGGPGCTRAVAQLTHKTAVSKMEELGCSSGRLGTRMREMALIRENEK